MKWCSLMVFLLAVTFTAARNSYNEYEETTPSFFEEKTTMAIRELGLPAGYEWLEITLSTMGNGFPAPELSEEQWIELQAIMDEDNFNQLLELYEGSWEPESSTSYLVVEDTTMRFVDDGEATTSLWRWFYGDDSSEEDNEEYVDYIEGLEGGDDDSLIDVIEKDYGYETTEFWEETTENYWDKITMRDPSIPAIPSGLDDIDRPFGPKYKIEDTFGDIKPTDTDWFTFAEVPERSTRNWALLIGLPIGCLVSLLLIIVGVVCGFRKRSQRNGVDYKQFPDDEKKVPV